MPPVNSSGESRDERIVLAFHERYWSDHGRKDVRPLSHYLALFPEHEDLIVAEYAQIRAESDAGSTTAATNTPFEAAPGTASDGSGGVGPYDLIRELGRGGQGVVYLAEDRRLGRKVALKVLEGLGPDADRHLQRFRREAEVASKLDHPGICGVHDAGIEGGVPYIAMRYVEGETLSAYVNRARRDQQSAKTEESFIDFSLMDSDAADDDTRRIEASDGSSPETSDDASDKLSTTSRSTRTSITRSQLDQLLRIFEQAARALHAAHESGIVHRDIKPGNIMLDGDGRTVILDFGLARDDNAAGPTLTQTGDLFGTPAYMSPEQVGGAQTRLDRRSDVFSLGVSLYECLTLTRPFEAPTREALYRTILEKEPTAPRRHNRSLPRDLEVVVETALRKDRDQRYATADVFADDLRAVRKHLPIVAKPVGIPGRMIRFAKRRPAAAALLLALIVGIPTVAGLGGYIFANQDDIQQQSKVRLEARVEKLIAEGFYLLDHGTPKQAEDHFTAARSLLPKSSEAIGGLALVALRTGSHETALSVLRDTQITSASLRRLEIKALRHLQRESEAEQIESTLIDDPNSPFDAYLTGHDALVDAHRIGFEHPDGLNALRRSVRSFERAITLSRTVRYSHYSSYAHAASHLPATEATSPVIDGLLLHWPDEALAWKLAADASRDRDHPSVVLERYERAVALDSDVFGGENIVGPLLELGRLEEALEVAQGAVRTNPDAESQVNLAIVFSRLARDDEALAAAKKAAGLAPKNAGVHTTLATIYNSLQRHDDALASAQEALRLAPLSRRAQLELAQILTETHRSVEAVAAWRKVSKQGLLTSDARSQFANALLFSFDFDGARDVLQSIIDDGTADGDTWGMMADVCTQTGDMDTAEDATEKAIELDPDNPMNYVTLANVRSARGDEPGAEQAARSALECDPECPQALALQGSFFAARGRLKEAIEYQEKAVSLAPHDVQLHAQLGLTLRYRGDIERAVEHLEKAASSRRPKVLFFLGEIRRENDELEAAVKLYRRVLEVEPNHAYAHCALGIVFSLRGQSDASIRHFRRGHEAGSRLSDWPSPSEDWLKEALRDGADAISKDNPTQAAAWWSEILTIAPNDVVALRRLAALQLDPASPKKLRDPARALAHATRAVNISRRQNAMALDVMARALFEFDLVTAAIEVMGEIEEIIDKEDVPEIDFDEFERRLEKYERRQRKRKRSDN